MNLIKNLLESGFRKSDDYQQRRVTLLTNSISLILVGVMMVLFLVRIVLFSHFCTPFDLLFEAVLMFVPIFLNRLYLPAASRLFLSIVLIIFIWYSFINGIKEMPSVAITVYDGLRLYLLAVSCVPFLILGRSNKVLFVIGILPSIISLLFFESILDVFGLKFIAPPGSDYELMQVRFFMSYILVAGSCYVLQRTIYKNDEINKRLLKRLQEKNAIIECQNRE